MARLIRRKSMERLELYDLDQYGSNYQLPPPLPPPRKLLFRRPSMNPSIERYQFLCDMTRSKTDPIYAATPMFTTIPQSSKENSQRQLLGAYARPENIKAILPTIPKAPEPKKVEIVEQQEEEEDEKENDMDEDDEADDDGDQLSSSSSGNDEQEAADDDDDKKGVVEQIFNRDKKD